MEKAGIEEIEATRMAVAMLLRDRPGSGDDRRACFECANLRQRSHCPTSLVQPCRHVPGLISRLPA